MARYIVRRLLWSFLLLVLVSAVVFILFYVFPSADPAQLRAGRQANEDQIQAIRESLGLDQSGPDAVLDLHQGRLHAARPARAPTPHGPVLLRPQLPVERRRQGRHPLRPARDRDAGHRRGDHLAARSRSRSGSSRRSGSRSLLDRTTMITDPGLHLGAGLLARTRRPLPVRPGRRRVPDLPRHRQLRRGRRLRRQGRLDDPALVRARGGDGGDLRPISALADDRRDAARTTSAPPAPRACRSGG